MAMARKLVRILKPERPDYQYLKKVFQHIRTLLDVSQTKPEKRLPDLLTDDELLAFYEAAWHAKNPNHLILIKLLVYTGIRNAEFTEVRLQDVDLDKCQIRIEQGKDKRIAMFCFPVASRASLLSTLLVKKKLEPVTS